MKTKTTAFRRLATSIALLVALCAQLTTAGAPSMDAFSSGVEALKVAPTTDSRVERLQVLEEMSRNIDQDSRVDREDVLAVAALLDDENYEVVHFAAMVLGNLGRRAEAAVPALEKSMDRLDAEEDRLLIKPAQPFATQVYVALSRIDGRPIPRGMGLRGEREE